MTLDFERHFPLKWRTNDDGYCIKVHQVTLTDSTVTHGIRLLQVQCLEQQVTGHAAGPLESLANHFVQVVETVQQPAGSQDRKQTRLLTQSGPRD